MRLLLLNYEYPPFGGGASAATYFMAKELVQQGHDVDVLTSGGAGLAAEEIVDGVRVHRVCSIRRGLHAAGLGGAASYLLFAARRLRRLTRENRFDCAHFFFALPTGALAPLWTRWTNCPYVVSLRGSDVPGYDSGRILSVLHWLLHGTMQHILEGASSVVANSASLRALATSSFPDIPMGVITNGVDTGSFRYNGVRTPHSPRRLVCVARLVGRKGLEELLGALALLKAEDTELTLVGEGSMRPLLEQQAKALGIAHRVTFAGVVGANEVGECYRQADCFVLPSLSESFSMALLEAMASGLPVVASRVGGIPELVEDGVNGKLVEPGSALALAQGLDSLLGDPLRMQRMQSLNRQKICNGYRWVHIVRAYEQHCYLPAVTDSGVTGVSNAVSSGGRH